MGLLDRIFGTSDNNYQQNNDYGYQQDNDYASRLWNDTIDEVANKLDDNAFQEADSLFKGLYSRLGYDKDFYYFSTRAWITLRWLESWTFDGDEHEAKLFARLKGLIKEAQNMASTDDDYDSISNLQSRFSDFQNEWSEYLSQREAWKSTVSIAETLYEDKKYVDAINAIEGYYSKYNLQKNQSYYDYLLKYITKMYDEMPYDDPEEKSVRKRMLNLIDEVSRILQDKEDIKYFTDNVFIPSYTRVLEHELSIVINTPQYERTFEVIEWYRSVIPDYSLRRISNCAIFLCDVWTAIPVNDVNYQKIKDSVEAEYKLWENSVVEKDDRIDYHTKYKLYFNDTKKMKLKEEADYEMSAEFVSSPTMYTEEEEAYKEEVLFLLADGAIGDVERRLLDRKRIKLGLTAERAAEIESACSTGTLSESEKEYVETYRDLVLDGNVSDRARRILDREAEQLGISASRAHELEIMAEDNTI